MALRHLRQGHYKSAVQNAALAALGPERYERLMFQMKVGYRPNLHDPRTFNEKIAWRKLYQGMPFAPTLADKLAVRDFVEGRVGGRYLNETIAVYDSAEAIRFESLPNAFVAKCTHGSKFNVLVPDKTTADLNDIRRRLAGFLATPDYGWTMNEWWYSVIEPKIVIEPFLTDDDWGIPVDYQFHVFDGKAAFVLLLHDRLRTRLLRYYDLDWRDLDLFHGHLAPLRPRPKHLGEMIEVAESLGRDLDFARIDLFYPSDREVLFAEVTLSPAAGWLKYNLRTTDDWIGSLWTPRPSLTLGEEAEQPAS